MKYIRYIAIWYLIFGVIAIGSFAAFKIGVFFGILGILLLGISFVRSRIKIIASASNVSFFNTTIIKVFLTVLPIIYTIFSFWMIQREYHQTLVVPKGYQGVVIVEYGQQDGQEKKWDWGFLGIGASREIKIDTMGHAKTQFDMTSIGHIPFFGSYNRATNTGMRILSEDGQQYPIDKLQTTSFEDLKKISENINTNTPILYLSEYCVPPLIVGILAKPSDYSTYFMSDKEIAKVHGSTYTDINMLKPTYKETIWETYNLKKDEL